MKKLSKKELGLVYIFISIILFLFFPFIIKFIVSMIVSIFNFHDLDLLNAYLIVFDVIIGIILFIKGLVKIFTKSEEKDKKRIFQFYFVLGLIFVFSIFLLKNFWWIGGLAWVLFFLPFGIILLLISYFRFRNYRRMKKLLDSKEESSIEIK